MLFVCENNQFATEVPFDYAAGNPERGRPRARPTACRASTVDGNDVLAVYRGGRRRRSSAPARAAGRRCSSARPTAPGPHAEGMGDFSYRTREEVEDWKKRCPIERLRDARACSTRLTIAMPSRSPQVRMPTESAVVADGPALRRGRVRGRTPATATAVRIYAETERARATAPTAQTAAGKPQSREITFMQAARSRRWRRRWREPADLRPGRGHRQARRQLQDDGRAVRQVRPGAAVRHADLRARASSAWHAAPP